MPELLQPRGYRDRPPPARSFSTRIRVLPCDGCGLPLVAPFGAARLGCTRCGDALEAPEAPNLTVPRTPAMPEDTRLQRLLAQKDHTLQVPPAVLRFEPLLDQDLPEARRTWGETRRRVERDPADAGAVDELVSLTVSLQNALPCSEDTALDRRSLAEGALEVLRPPHLRQFMLGHLTRDAARVGDLDSAGAWLERMDPASDHLLAHSSHRVSAAMVAAARQDWLAVLDALGAAHGEIPFHPSQRGIEAALRAGAHEKLGNMDRAADELRRHARTRTSALTGLHSFVGRTPSWGLCTTALARITPEELERSCEHLAGAASALFAVAAMALVCGVVLFAVEGDTTPGLLVALALGAIAAVALAIRDVRRVRRIVRGSVPAHGRVVGAHALGAGQVHLDLVVEPAGAPPVRTSTVTSLPSSLTPESVSGRSYDGFWNPEHPRVCVQMIFMLPPEDLAGARPPAEQDPS